MDGTSNAHIHKSYYGGMEIVNINAIWMVGERFISASFSTSSHKMHHAFFLDEGKPWSDRIRLALKLGSIRDCTQAKIDAMNEWLSDESNVRSLDKTWAVANIARLEAEMTKAQADFARCQEIAQAE